MWANGLGQASSEDIRMHAYLNSYTKKPHRDEVMALHLSCCVRIVPLIPSFQSHTVQFNKNQTHSSACVLELLYWWMDCQILIHMPVGAELCRLFIAFRLNQINPSPSISVLPHDTLGVVRTLELKYDSCPHFYVFKHQPEVQYLGMGLSALRPHHITGIVI